MRGGQKARGGALASGTRGRSLYQQSDSDGLSDVELEQAKTPTKHCIDYASPFYIYLVMILYLGLVTFYGLTGMAAPSKLLKAVQKVPVALSEGQTSATIDVRLLDLHECDYEFELNCTAVRRKADASPAAVRVAMKETHWFLQNFTDVGTVQSSASNGTIRFANGAVESSAIRVLTIKVAGFDTVALSLELDVDYTRIEEFKFSYYYMNPACPRFLKITRYILSATVVYGLVVFLIGNSCDSWTYVMAVMLGVTGVLASNPPQKLIPDDWAAKNMLNNTVWSLFVNFFRFVLINMLNSVRTKSFSFAPCFTFLTGLIFSAFWFVDVRADYAHDQSLMKYASSMNDHSLSDDEIAQFVFLAIYLAMALSLVCSIACNCSDMEKRGYLKPFGLMVILCTSLATVVFDRMFLNVYGIGQFLTLPDLLIDSSHFLGAAACLIWLKPVAYEDMDYEGPGRNFILEDRAFGNAHAFW